MATVRILLGIVWLAVVGWCTLRNGNLLIGFERFNTNCASSFVAWDGQVFERSLIARRVPNPRDRIITIARAELGVKEKTGQNDGERVEEYLAAVGLKRGDPYCAAFVSWVFKQAGYAQPKTGWSPALFPASKIVKEARSADIFGIWFPDLKRIAHAGFVERRQGDFLQTIEANTDLSGSREGEGVYRKMRHKRAIYRFADWLNIPTNWACL